MKTTVMNNKENNITISSSFNYKCDKREHVKTEGMSGKSDDGIQL